MGVYTDRYSMYMDTVLQKKNRILATGKKPVFAYTSNIDMVLKWNADTYNRILEEYPMGKGPTKGDGVIETIEDFVQISSSYISRGLGGNFQIKNYEVCRFLQSEFETEHALGGTAAQGAAAISAMGMDACVHLTDCSPEVCALMATPELTTILRGEEVGLKECATCERPVVHFVLQFQKDDSLRIGGENIKIPLSNRLILFYDEIHKVIPIKQDFIEYWNKNAGRISSYLISGFDAVTDPEIMRERLELLKNHITSVKKKNAGTVIYFEGAFYMDSDIKQMVFHTLGTHMDVCGMSEEELTELAERNHVSVILQNPESVIHAMDVFRKRYCLRGVVLHTKDYAMYYGDEIEGSDMEFGLTMGNIMSATRARTGRYGSPSDCRRTLELQLSGRGLEFAEKISELKVDDVLKIVPSRYLEYPKYTIGLGDTFTAGVQLAFI